jgi:group II intron reverse transcriptase/maturase
VIDLDIKGYFDNIDHELLMKAVEKHVPEKWVRMYIERWLKAGVLHTDGQREKSEKGTPQGGVISPVLANLYLHYAFDKWMDRNASGVCFERYADDIIVHCKSEEEAIKLLECIKTRLRACRLEVHPEKTRIVYCANSNRNEKTKRPKKFTFLGYDFKPRKRMNRRSRKKFVGFDLGISKKAIVRIRSAVREELDNVTADMTLEDIAGILNARLRGWIGYYARLSRWDTRVVWHWLNYRLVLWRMRHFKRHKNGCRSASKWLYSCYKGSPDLFAHWCLAAPGRVLRRAV